MEPELKRFFNGRGILVTGGAGFIGSNLARRLVDLGARVTVVDALLPDHGGNLFNLDGIRNRVQLHIADVRDGNRLSQLVLDQDIIFNLAGQVSHEDSVRDPMADLEMNCHTTVCLLEACRRHNPKARVIFAGTRQVYGRPQYLPVDENHPLRPVDPNGISKLAAEHYHLLYHQLFGLWTSVLRLTNTYGPRQLIRHPRQGFIPWFIGKALQGGAIQVYGDGRQQRDATYVDDVVEAFLLTSMSEAANGEVFNLGGTVVSLLDLARMVAEMCPPAFCETVPFPVERRRIDIGSYVAKWDKVRATLGWAPRIALPEGLRRAIDYYQKFGSYYQ